MRMTQPLYTSIASIFFMALLPKYKQDGLTLLFKVSFYMIGMKEIDESITFDIGRNIDYLNEEIERRFSLRSEGYLIYGH